MQNRAKKHRTKVATLDTLESIEEKIESTLRELKELNYTRQNLQCEYIVNSIEEFIGLCSEHEVNTIYKILKLKDN